MLDDLRGDDDFEEFEEFEEDIDDFDFKGQVIGEEDASESGPFLGMNPSERMLLSIFLFLNVTVLGLALLVATGRIVF